MSNMIIHHYESKEPNLDRLPSGAIDLRLDADTVILFRSTEDAHEFADGILAGLCDLEMRERLEREMDRAPAIQIDDGVRDVLGVK
jgi:hypothetical protein